MTRHLARIALAVAPLARSFRSADAVAIFPYDGMSMRLDLIYRHGPCEVAVRIAVVQAVWGVLFGLEVGEMAIDLAAQTITGVTGVTGVEGTIAAIIDALRAVGEGARDPQWTLAGAGFAVAGPATWPRPAPPMTGGDSSPPLSTG